MEIKMGGSWKIIIPCIWDLKHCQCISEGHYFKTITILILPPHNQVILYKVFNPITPTRFMMYNNYDLFSA